MAEEKKLPGTMAGITSYDVNPEKVRMKPIHVVGIISLVIVVEAMLYLFL